MSREALKWYDPNTDNPPWIKALAEVRRLAPREGWRYQHVQAIIVSIAQVDEHSVSTVASECRNQDNGLRDRGSQH